ncbi:MAG TPA: hypothetical protein VNB59_04980 [Solirubrobacterales bacterium]|jgi:hypothetical protein|nr:hypothetical protein [Solirubrobacterales bacterium]
MNEDQTPINARPRRRPPEAIEDLSLALREHLVWPVEDWALGLGDRSRALVAGGAVVAAILVGTGGFALVASGGSGSKQTQAAAVAVTPASKSAALSPEPKPAPEPTLHGAAPVFKPATEDSSKVGGSKAVEAGAAKATAADTGSAATDTISSTPAAPTAKASASAIAVDGPPAGPAAIAVAREFAETFVVYETGGEKSVVRKGFAATATPELTKALLRRPPRQPAGVEVPKAKVLNVVPAPSHGTVYPLSVSLLRVGITSELRLQMEQLKSKEWRVINVLG